MNLIALQSLIAQGESETLELKRSTAELKRAGETLCAFLNGDGGRDHWPDCYTVLMAGGGVRGGAGDGID